MKSIYHIPSANCQHCKESIEKSLLFHKNIKRVSFNLQTKTLTVESATHISLPSLEKQLKKSGLHYQIQNLNGNMKQKKPLQKGTFYCPMRCEGNKTYHSAKPCPICGMDMVVQQNSELNHSPLRKKLAISVVLTVPVVIMSMSGIFKGLPLIEKAMGWLQLILTLPIIFYSGWEYFKRAKTSIISGHLNMFTLIGLGTSAAFIFSVFSLLFPSFFPDEFKTSEALGYLYFESVAVILTLVQLGQYIEAKAHIKTRSAIKGLLKLIPDQTTIVKATGQKKIKVEEVKIGDILMIKPGDRIPVDGRIYQGNALVDESMITGEPIALEKSENDRVVSGTINKGSSFLMATEKIGRNTLVSQIIEMVEKATASKANLQKMADRVSRYFVPLVITLSALTLFGWLLLSSESSFIYGFASAISVLIIACPCALGLATPISIMVGMGRAAQWGILIKNASALETAGFIKVILTDKTGTLTKGHPSVKSIKCIQKSDEQLALKILKSLNDKSEHPLAEAILRFTSRQQFASGEVTYFNNLPGMGVEGILDKKKVAVGNGVLLKKNGIAIPPTQKKEIKKQQSEGKTISYIISEGKMLGYIIIFDKIKSNAYKAIATLRNAGIRVIMLTGDSKQAARNVAEQLALSGYHAQCLPSDKMQKVKDIQSKKYRVAMVGDGVNDSPALSQADVGIAMDTGTNIAINSADIVLLNGNLQGIIRVIKLSKATLKNIKQNLFLAFFYNLIGIPIAMGVLFPIFGILLSPMVAALAMSISSISVICNALRIQNSTL